MLPFERFVLNTSVTIAARTVMMFDDLMDSVEAIGAVDAAEIDGTPLNKLTGRVSGGAGNADDITEYAGRQCYSSWSKGRDQEDYIGNILRDAHGSVMEHANLVFQVTGVSRALTHELIRHRVGTAFSQQSQRYVDAAEIRFVIPPLILSKYPDAAPTERDLMGDAEFLHFNASCARALADYIEAQRLYKKRMRQELADLIDAGLTEEETTKRRTAIRKRANEAARANLPNAAETMLVFTTNIRALRHIVTLRGSIHADLEIRRFSGALLDAARPHAPVQLKDIIPTDDEGDEFFAGIVSKLDKAA